MVTAGGFRDFRQQESKELVWKPDPKTTMLSRDRYSLGFCMVSLFLVNPDVGVAQNDQP